MKNKKPYYHNKKAWVDSTIMIDILSNFNKKLAQQQQNILLFLDNVSSHTPELSEMFSHIKVIFLPKNTTSRLQLLDAGIIKNFKVHDRKKLITHALAQIGSTSGTEIAKQVDVLHAIRWIKQAWDQVEVSTIQHCFNHCGFSYISVPTGDPFADLNKDESLKQIVKPLDTEMSAEIPTSATFEDDDNWREELHNMVISSIDDEESEQEGSVDEEIPALSISSFDEAIKVASDLLLFLTYEGQENISEQLFTVLQLMEHAKLNRAQQTSIM